MAQWVTSINHLEDLTQPSLNFIKDRIIVLS